MKKYTLKKRLSALFAICLLCLAFSSCGSEPLPAQTPDAPSAASAEVEKPPTSEHPDAPTSYSFDSLRELAAAYNAKKQGLDAPADRTENAAVLFEREDEANLLFDTFGNLPFPVLGEDMHFLTMSFYPEGNPPELNPVYTNSTTGDFIRFSISPGYSMQEYVEEYYPDTESFTVREFGGQTVYFYLKEQYEGDLRRMRGVFEIDGVAVVITCGRYPYENPENITFDYFTAPLENMTVSTLYEQMGVEQGTKQK